MAISSETKYYEMLASPFERARISKSALTVTAGRSFSSWLQGAGFPAAGTTPGASAAVTMATTGSLKGNNGNDLTNGSGTRRILKVILDYAPSATPGGMITIADRLVHQGGSSGTVTGAQTTNLPTAALTRYTTGVGVQMALEIYSQVGATGPTTITTSYTNTVPTAGRASPLVPFGNTNAREASRFIMVPFAEGDIGVTAVANVNLLASTLTAGSFGVTLYYPLVHIPLDDILSLKGYCEALYGFGTWFPEVKASACLQFIYHMAGTSTGIVQGDVLISEDR